MDVRIEAPEIRQAIIDLVAGTIPNVKVTDITFHRQKGGDVYADAKVEITQPKPASK